MSMRPRHIISSSEAPTPNLRGPKVQPVPAPDARIVIVAGAMQAQAAEVLRAVDPERTPRQEAAMQAMKTLTIALMNLVNIPGSKDAAYGLVLDHKSKFPELEANLGDRRTERPIGNKEWSVTIIVNKNTGEYEFMVR